MSGLLLTNYYLVYRSVFAYSGLAILVSGLMLFFGDTSMYRFAALLTTLLVAMPAIEIIKYEGKSGYDKYVLTLPVSRSNIVKSHYFFYLLTVIIGTILSYAILYVYGLISESPINAILNIVFLGTVIVLISGAIAYPFLYVFGLEKSDAISIGSAFGGLVTTLGLQSLVGYLIEQLPLNIDHSLFVPVIFLLFGIIIYILSFFVAALIYRRKEF
ncbi:ABC-2 transporter permease [Bacillus sp. SM2101]|uniref:ABC-2 transporter permease n=1 Tax=Bacillus sp. SM2101 TaxID=2805366 RepID=UPI001BDEC64B